MGMGIVKTCVSVARRKRMNRFREWSGDGGSDGGGAGAWIEEEVVIFETEETKTRVECITIFSY